MNKLLIALMVFGLTGVGFAEVEQKPQKCEVVFEVTYNAITFDKASDVEMLMKKRFKDACKVKIKSVKPLDNSNFNSSVTYFSFDDTTGSSIQEVEN